MIALDLDGTLIDYNYAVGREPLVNIGLIQWLREWKSDQRMTAVALVTNQGGLPWGVLDAKRKDGRLYPKPKDFAIRINAAINALRHAGIPVDMVRVSVFHPNAPQAAIDKAAVEVRSLLGVIAAAGVIRHDWHVYTTARSRKPSPMMLRSALAHIYIGDSPEDKAAAENAGIRFIPCERF